MTTQSDAPSSQEFVRRLKEEISRSPKQRVHTMPGASTTDGRMKKEGR